MPQGKKLVWEAFKTSFHLKNTFNHTGKLRYTWDNRRRDGCRIHGRLDKHYVSFSPESNLHLSTHNYAIKGDYPALDHLPVSIKVILQDSDQRKTYYKMNTYYLQHAKVKGAVKRIWSEERSESNNFFTRLRKFTRFYRSFYKRQATESRRQETEARTALVAA